MDQNLINSIKQYGQNQLIDPKTALNFEQRVLRPSDYPSINNPDGSYSTHKMMWNEMGNKFGAFPSIVQLPTGKLVELDPRSAYNHAISNNEYRTFNSAKEAQEYAEGGYKRSWGTGERN